ncbi:MAG: phosphoglucosamine mutase, partial [Oscillospiraceae bacterium]|nr:phosphoglucosamine mutase [Oscillospiraceae bacterium]
SASHNSVEFNGIKLFAADGRKLSDEMEAEIESLILDRPEELRVAAGTAVGRLRRFQNAAEMYVTHLAELIPTRLDGMRIAIDCANGSASPVAESFFHRLGAEVEVIHAAPDGCNINAGCGSTHIDGLMQHVTEGKFDAGLAFDGDADRCLAVDETGDLVDGDKMIAIMAKAYKDAGKLNNNTVVVTVMSNLGFTQFAKQEGIRRITSNVGDRYVIDTMMLGGYNLGGEQNGHLFFLDDVPTGDGLLSGAKLLEVMRNSGQKMSELASIMKRYPQVMINVRIPHYQRENWKNDGVITQLIDQYEQELGSEGRILVRESGTEPLIRVMIEGSDFKRINVIAMEIAELIRQRICK